MPVRKLTTAVLALALLAISFAGIRQAVAADTLTVAQAIATQDNSTQTVRGYIVGIVSSTTVVQAEPPFTAKTNFAIADSPNETDTTKMLYVQLPNTSLRTQHNLADNPGRHRQLIEATGTLEPYFTLHAGLKNPTAINIIAAPRPARRPR